MILLNETTTFIYQKSKLNSHFEIIHPKLNSENYRGHIETGYGFGRPLVGIIILASLFLCTLIGALLVILIFCKKKNTVFVLPKSTLSEAWRSSIEMNSLHSGSLSEITGDWFMFCNSKKFQASSTSKLNESLQHGNNNVPMSVESAFLLHLVGSNKNLDSNYISSKHKINSLPRSYSCHSNFSFKLPSISAFKKVVSKRGLKLPVSRTYERLGNPDDQDSNALNSSIFFNPNADESIIDVYGCAVSKRPWLNNKDLEVYPIPSDYSNLKININRESYGARKVYLSK